MVEKTPADPEFEALLRYIQESRGLDFRGYKRTSLSRRIALRMEAVGVEHFSAYQAHLEVHPGEFGDLLNTVLINVTSFFRDQPVIGLIMEKLPVSISLGLWTTLLIYLISIPLGIRKAVRDGSWFDIWTSTVIIVGYAIPSFLFALLLILLFGGGSYWQVFPLRGLTSDNWETFTAFGKITDYFWHMTLPITAMVISGFASLTMLTKNSFLDEIGKQYVMTARAKGLTERAVLMKHVFRNAMLIVIAGFPGALIRILFTSSLLIEIIFSLDGLGLLSYEAALGRDYPIVFGSLYLFTLIGLLFNLLGDIAYVAVDPRIDFNKREV